MILLSNEINSHLVGLNIETLRNAGLGAVAQEAFLAEAAWLVILCDALREWNCAPVFFPY